MLPTIIPGHREIRMMGALDIGRCMDYANDLSPARRGRLWVSAFKACADALGYFRSCRAICRCHQVPHNPECGLVILYDPEGELFDLTEMGVREGPVDTWPHFSCKPAPREPAIEVLGLPAPVPDDAEYRHGEVVDTDPDKLMEHYRAD